MLGADKNFTLVIDAGHGGKDSGAQGVISKEKDINLNVALAFGRYVEMNCPDVRVVYTRKSDVFVTLMGRAEIANKAKADLFVSVHTNAVERGYIKGFEVYTLGMHRASDNLDVAKRENAVITLESGYQSRYQGFDPNSSESYIMFEYMQDKNMENSVLLAQHIQKSVCNSATRINKGIHQAGFLVLRETSMPSCLIELGFISTPEEERELNDPIVQDQMARGIFQAFQNYRGKTTTSINYPVFVEENAVIKDTTEKKEEVQPRSEPPVEVQPVQKKVEVKEEKAASQQKKDVSNLPVFKVQVLVSSRVLNNNDVNLKGLTGVDYYKESGMVKYTYGASVNYNEIYKLRKQIIYKFPQAFIVAFKDGNKVDVNMAIKEWKEKR